MAKFTGNSIDRVWFDEMVGYKVYDQTYDMNTVRMAADLARQINRRAEDEQEFIRQSVDGAAEKPDLMKDFEKAVDRIWDEFDHCNKEIMHLKRVTADVELDVRDLTGVAQIAKDPEGMLKNAAKVVEDRLNKRVTEELSSINNGMAMFQRVVLERLDEMAKRIELVNSEYGRF